MCIALIFSASSACCAAPDDDKVTLTINATCVADSTLTDPHGLSMKDKITAVLSERAVYRIVAVEGGLLELELVNHSNTVQISGGGTYKDPTESRSWTYVAGKPATDNVQGGVSIDTLHGTGKIYINDFMAAIGAKASPEDAQAGSAYGEADMTFGTATGESFPSQTLFESNESFLKGLHFTFDPKSKHISADGQANYNLARKGEDGHYIGTGKLNVSYQVQSGMPPAAPSVVLIPKGDYKKWLPGAKGPDTPGNTITFDVELRDPEGGKAKEKTAQFEIELLNTSSHPGSAMNSPWTGVAPDLKILKANNPKLAEVSPDGQTAKTAKGLKSAGITISSFDGAAMGKLTVLARIDGEDTVLTAQLENEKGITEVNIPYDSDGNTIADAWEEANEVLGKPLDTDEDAEPLGDRNNGDGLTTWEEYRGFLEDGRYIRTDPKKKDLFICDQIGGRSKRAINRFAALTKLDVHHNLTVDELDYTRIINRNRSKDAPHVVDQHGLLIEDFVRDPEKVRFIGKAYGGPGTPKSISRIVIDKNLANKTTVNLGKGVTKTYEYFTPVVAHELLHACNVWHHGQTDERVYWKSKTVDGKKELFEYDNEANCNDPDFGHRITAYFGEDTTRFHPAHLPVWENPLPIQKGQIIGQHSGNEDCVMRYDSSEAIYTGGPDGDRYCLIWESQEPVGQGLCTSRDGTGVNEWDRKPKSRYWMAFEGRGACADKICVNDLYH
jgi:hypothetical protein